MALSQSQAYKSWCGYAFETVCLQHVPQIKEALRIGGIYTQSSTFYQAGNKDKEGAQIDLLLDRNDGVVNLIETTFYDGPYRVVPCVAATTYLYQSCGFCSAQPAFGAAIIISVPEQ